MRKVCALSPFMCTNEAQLVTVVIQLQLRMAINACLSADRSIGAEVGDGGGKMANGRR